MVPLLCPPGDDAQYGSAAVCDVAGLQALSRRIHYGMFVAESKYQEQPAPFAELISAKDAAGLRRLITHPEVEGRVLHRVAVKARTYAQEVAGRQEQHKLEPAKVAEIYRRWIIPMTKDVEVEYLLNRPLSG
jgi:chorismate mutase